MRLGQSLLIILGAGFPLFFPMIVLAQSIRPANDDTGTIVTHEGQRYTISGGQLSGDRTNLFHSFERLGLNTNEIANFLSNPQIRVILGRVTGGNASIIDGLLRVSGGPSQLYLMNPAGIVFGPNARLNLPASFTATTATGIGFASGLFGAIGTPNYSALVGTPQTFAFDTLQPGTIVNSGFLSVNAGEQLTLLGGSVINTGTLAAPGGAITVASVAGGQRIRLSQTGALLSLELEATPPEASNPLPWTPLSLPQLLTGGEISGATGLSVDASGAVRLTGSGVVVPLTTGTTLVSGRLDASTSDPTMTTTPQVAILGDRVGVIGATLDGSGAASGGTVRIGGDYQGRGGVFNASHTFVDDTSLIRADAGQTGTGGRVIAWGNDVTRFGGTVTARGGLIAGDGGFVEVSSHGDLVFAGTVDVTASHGQVGTLLLDPTNITIDNTPSSVGVDDFLPTILQDQPQLPGDITVSADTLQNQLGNIILEATDNIAIASGVSLNFAAPGGDVTGAPPLTIRFTADADNNGTGDFFMDQTQSITALGRSLTISGVNVTTGTINVGDFGTSPIDGRAAGSVNLTATGGNLTVGDVTTSANADFLGDSLVQGAGSVTLSAPAGTVTVGNIDAAAFIDGFISGDGGTININAGAGIQTGNINALSGGGSGGAIAIATTNGSITTGSLQSLSLGGGGGRDITLTADNGNITTGNLEAYGNSTAIGGAVSLNAVNGVITPGTITTDNNAITLAGSVLLNGDTSLSNRGTSGDITLTGSVDGGNALTLQSGTGNVTFNGAIGSTTPLGTVTINSAGATRFDGSVEADSLTTDAGGTTQLSGNVTTRGLGGQRYGDLLTLVGDISLTGDKISFLSPVSGTGNITIQPVTPSQAIALGGTTDSGPDTLNLLSSDLTALQNGFSAITIGRPDGSGAITVNGDVTFNDPITLRSPLDSGSINTTGGTITGDDNATITLLANQAITTGNITNPGRAITLISTAGAIDTTAGTLNSGFVPETTNRGVITGSGADITLSGTALTLGDINTSIRSGNVENAGNVLLTATSGDITVGQINTQAFSYFGFIGNAGNVTLNAQTGNVTVNTGIVADTTAVGAADTAGNAGTIQITATNGAINVNNSLSAQAIANGEDTTAGNGGRIALNGAILNLGIPAITTGTITPGTGATAGTGANVELTGAINLSQPVTTLTTQGSAGGGDVVFNGPLNGTTAESNALAIDAGTGNITFNDAVGNLTGLGDLTLNNTGRATFTNSVTANSLTTSTSGTTQLNGNVTTTGPTGQTYNNPLTLGSNLTLSGDALNFANTVTGESAITLQPFSSDRAIVLGGSADSGTGALALSDATLTALQTGLTSLTLGRPDGTGTLTLGGNVTFNQPTTLQANAIDTTGGEISGAGNATLTLLANQDLTTGVITNPGRSITLTSQNGAIDTTGGELNTFSRDVAGGAIALNAANTITTGTLTLGSGIAGLGGGDLTVVSPTVTLGALNTNGVNLRLGSADSRVNAQLTGNILTSGGNIALFANNNLTFNQDIRTQGGNLNLNSTRRINLSGAVETQGGNITLRGIQVDVGDLDSSNSQGPGGTMMLRATDGDLNTGDLNSTGSEGGGAIALNADDQIQTGAITFGSTTADVESGTLTVNAPSVSLGALTSNGTNLTLGSPDNRINLQLTGPIASGGGNVTLFPDGDFTLTRNLQTNGGNLIIRGANGINLSGSVQTTGGMIILRGTTIDTTATTLDSSNDAGTGGDVMLQANGGAIATGRIDSTGSTGSGAIALTASGAITTGPLLFGLNPDPNPGSNPDSTSGGLTILTSGDIQINGLTSNGAAIILNNDTTTPNNVTLSGALNLGSSALNIATLGGFTLSSDLVTSGTDVAIASANTINLTGAIRTNGGAIRLQGNQLNTADLSTQNASGSGGAIALQANDSVSTGALDTSSTTGNGGSVSINASGDIQVNTINTRSDSGRGGDVLIQAGRFFRAIGVLGDNSNTSITTAGNPEGLISIEHGGRGLVPFVVGSNPTNGAAGNGTTGRITSGSSTINPTATFRGSVQQGSTISIRTAFQESNQQVVGQVESHISPERTRRVPTTQATPATVAVPQPRSQPVEYFQFKDADQVRNSLVEVQAKANLKTALIYVNFVPATSTGGLGYADREAASAQEFATYFGQSAPINPGSTTTYAPRDDDRLEILMITAKGEPIIKRLNVTRGEVRQVAKRFISKLTDRSRANSDDYLFEAQQLYQWLVAPIEDTLSDQEIQNLSFIMDAGLRSLPIAALHDGYQFLIERYSVGLLPSISLTDTSYVDLRNVQVLAMGASEFRTLPPLPAVPVEISTIANRLWPGEALLNQQFTLKNLIEERSRRPFGIVHLATHAEFRPGRVQNSYIQFWDQQLRLDQLREMGLNKPPVQLLVLSACRTALGDEQAELGFAGLAVQAGVKSALASLWYVSDEATLAFMTEFYQQLREVPIKAEALRRTQLAMLRGEIRVEGNELRGSRGAIPLPPALAEEGRRNLSHPFYWAGLTLVGSPW
jgi:filamentous hemagglutinin family protein